MLQKSNITLKSAIILTWINIIDYKTLYLQKIKLLAGDKNGRYSFIVSN